MKSLDVLAISSVTYHEDRIRSFIKKFCDKNKIKYWNDAIGDVWLNASSSSDVKKFKKIIVAHFDSPGIIMTGKTSGYWYGPAPKISAGQSVRLFGEDALDAKIVEFNPQTRSVKISAKSNARAGHLIFPNISDGYKISNGKIFARCANNLISVAAILASLETNPNSHTGVLLTRSESDPEESIWRVIKTHGLGRKIKFFMTDITRERWNFKQGSGVLIRSKEGKTKYGASATSFAKTAASKMKVKHYFGCVPSEREEAKLLAQDGYNAASVGIAVKNLYNNPESGGSDPAPEMVLASDVFQFKSFIDGLL